MEPGELIANLQAIYDRLGPHMTAAERRHLSQAADTIEGQEEALGRKRIKAIHQQFVDDCEEDAYGTAGTNAGAHARGADLLLRRLEAEFDRSSPGTTREKKGRCPTCKSSSPLFSQCIDRMQAEEEGFTDIPTPNPALGIAGCGNPWHDQPVVFPDDRSSPGTTGSKQAGEKNSQGSEATKQLAPQEQLEGAVREAIDKLAEADKAEWGDDADALSQEARLLLLAALSNTPPRAEEADRG